MARKRSLGDIAQHVVGLMEDPSRWRAGFLCVSHTEAPITIRNTGFSVSVAVSGARFAFEGRDARAVDKAYGRLKKGMERLKRDAAAQKVREALTLPLAAETAAPLESIEAVEARVRRLREAVFAEARRTEPA
jgi:hypothetical protein